MQTFNSDYEKERRQAWIYSLITFAVMLVLLATSMHTYTHFEESYAAGNLFEFFCSTTLQMYVPAAPSLSYIVLLRSLYKRFGVLNSMFR